MELEGKAKNHAGMNSVQHTMNMVFGETVKLKSYYGPVQMCVFGLEYEYLPENYIIKLECERGFNI